MGQYGTPTPSTSWTGTNPWPWSNNPSTLHPRISAVPRLGRAPWPGLAHILEDRTQSPSPPPVELSVYHPLQTTTWHRSPTPIPSSTGTSLSRFESAPTSPKISQPPSPTTSTPMKTSECHESPSSSRPEERRTPFNVDGPDFEWPELSDADRGIMGIARATAWEFRRRDVEDRTTDGPPPGPREPMAPLPRPQPRGAHSVLLTPLPYLSDSSSMPIARYGIPLRDEDYSTFDPQTADKQGALEHALTCIVCKKNHGAPELPCRFPRGYAAGYDTPHAVTPTRHHIGGMERIEERGRAALSQQQMETRRWQEGDQYHRGPPNPTNEERLEQARTPVQSRTTKGRSTGTRDRGLETRTMTRS